MLYVHDCKKCKYIGTVNDLDFYYHELPAEGGFEARTYYIARYSPEDGDYAAVSDFRNKLYNELKATIGYMGKSEEAQELDLRRRTAIELLGWAIANSMERI